MWKKVWEYIREYEILKPEDRVVVALSGGADSVCLLAVLAENTMAVRLRAVHVHHGIRKEEADRDAEYVRKLCRDLGVPLEVIYRNVPEYAGMHGLSLEEAGRKLRYEALEHVAWHWEQEEKERVMEKKEHDRPVWIAVAHHQDDQAETILHHLFRGSGLRGLAGMGPVQGNRIRPLLGVRKQEILEYLREKGLEWCEDSTNESEEYTRNRIRRELIPYITENINRHGVENVLRAGRLFGETDRYLRQQAEIVWQRSGSVEREEEGAFVRAYMDLGDFGRQDPLIRSYLIRRMLDLASPGQKDITSKHFEQIDRLAKGRDDKSCDLPGTVKAVRTGRTIGIESGEPRGNTGKQEELQRERKPIFLPLPTLQKGRQRLGNMEFQVFLREKEAEIPKKQYTKWFDYDKIKDTLSVRYRQPGDFLTLPGGQRKTLRRFLIDEKVPREHRERIVVLAEGSHVLWVVGYRISEYYKIVEGTHKILEVEFYGGKGYGGQDPGIIVRRRGESKDQ